MKKILYLLLLIPSLVFGQAPFKTNAIQVDTIRSLKGNGKVIIKDTVVFKNGEKQTSAFTEALKNNLGTAYNTYHVHLNKPILDGIKASDTTRWAQGSGGSNSNLITMPGTFKIPFNHNNTTILPYALTGNTTFTEDTAGHISGATTLLQIYNSTGNSYTAYFGGNLYAINGSSVDSFQVAANQVHTYLLGCMGYGSDAIYNYALQRVKTKVGVPVQLSPQTSFTANGISTSQIDLSWVNASPLGRGSKIDSASTAGGSFTTLVALKNKTATTHSVTGLHAGHTTYFRISNVGNGSDTLTSTYATANATTATPGAPTFVSANTSVNGDTVHMLFSKAMQTSPSSTGLIFSPSKTISSITRHATNTSQYDIVVSVPFTSANTITTSYSPGTITANDGGVLGSFSSQSVTNNVPEPPTISSAYTSATGDTIYFIGSKAWNSSLSSTGLTTSPSKTISAVGRKTTNTSIFYIVISVPFTSSDVITVNYTPGTITSSDGGVLAGFTGQAVTNNVASSIPRTGLVGEWLFANNYNDGSGNSYNGTRIGTNSTFVADKIGNASSALSLSSTDTYIDIGTQTNLNLTGQFTISFWVKALNTVPSKLIMADANSTTTDHQFFINFTAASKLILSHNNGQASIFSGTGSSTILANSWYHIIIKRTGSTGNWGVTMKVNNATETVTLSHAEVNPGSQHDFTIGTGGQYGHSTCFTGSLDNIRIYNRLTTDEEDTILYNELP